MLKFSDLPDYILAILYKLRIKSGPNKYSINDIVKFLGFELDTSELQEIGKYLEAKGFVELEFIYGDILAQIKPQGMMEYESKSDNVKYLPTFQEFLGEREKLNKIEDVVGILNSSTVEKSKKAVFEEIDRIKKEVDNIYPDHSDLDADLEIIQMEIKKSKPDYNSLRIKISALEDLDYKLKTLLKGLKSMLNFVDFSY